MSTTQRREFRRHKLFDRLVYYLIRRTARRHISGQERGEEWKTAFEREVRQLTDQIKRLLKLRKKESLGDHFGTLSRFSGSYSLSWSISSESLEAVHQRGIVFRAVEKRDATKRRNQQYDLIITDPPYGFNTDDDPKDLAELYSKVIDVMVQQLSEGGQLVFALPDKSHNGRRVPAFVSKEFVIRQVLVASERAGREVVHSSDIVPRAGLFRPPFYWESERALRRAILHFRFRSQPTYQTERTPRRNQSS